MSTRRNAECLKKALSPRKIYLKKLVFEINVLAYFPAYLVYKSRRSFKSRWILSV